MSMSIRAKLGSAVAVVAAAGALLVGAAGGAEASTGFYAPSLPWTTSPSPSVPWTSSINICFGGDLCGGPGNVINVDMPRSYVRTISVQANDNVGDKHKATLFVFVDGVKIGAADVLQSGSVLTFNANRYGSRVTLSASETGTSWSDEIVANGILLQS